MSFLSLLFTGSWFCLIVIIRHLAILELSLWQVTVLSLVNHHSIPLYFPYFYYSISCCPYLLIFRDI